MKDDKILTEARDRFDKASEAERENRRLAEEDFQFAGGDQWPDAIKAARKATDRPCLTFNRLPQFIAQVMGDARQNKPAIKVSPVDSGADIETAEIFEGLIRNIESQSRAEAAYITALDHSVTGGFGNWRVITEYSSDDSFEQDIRIRRITDPFAVFWDPGAREYDKSDAEYCFVSEWMTKDTFKAKYPKASVSDWEGDLGRVRASQAWVQGDRVRLVEYWVKKPVTRWIGRMPDGSTVELKNNNPELLVDGQLITLDKMREVKSHKVCRYVLSGHEVVEEEKEFPSRYIPIVPVFGPEEWVNGTTRVRSLIRYAKDPQRMYNFWQPLALDTPLPTPDGWTTMGSVKVGDSLYDEAGKPCKVIGKSPVHINRECYRVSFGDGSSIVADAGHPWVVSERSKRTAKGFTWSQKKIQTKDLVPGNHFIAATKPLDGGGSLPIHPYVLGLWLGDGHSSGGRISVGDKDAADTMRNIEECGYRVSRGAGKNASIGVYGLLVQLRSAGLLNNKHVPCEYLRASESDRLSLIQGLMDSDGSISGSNGSCYFNNTNKVIAGGFAELLRTFGIRAKCVSIDGRKAVINGFATQGVEFQQFNFTTRLPVFRLERKLCKIGRRAHEPRRTDQHAIVAVEPVASVPVQCVAIDAPSHLFLAGESMIPTHNTAIAEKIALAPKSPWLVTTGMVDGLEPFWNAANRENRAYLPYNPDVNSPGNYPRRQEPASVNSAEIQQSAQAVDDLKATMGMYDASLGASGNETSGRAIIARQREGDNSSYAWIDNLARSIQHTGRILIDMIPRIYDTERIVRVLGADDTADLIPINQWDEAEGRFVHDLSVGKYDVEISVGPSYATKRMEAADSLLQFVQAVPMAGQVAADLIAKAMDWPGADEIAERLKKMLPPGIAEEEEEGSPEAMVAQLQQQLQELSQQNEMMQAALQGVDEAENARKDAETQAKVMTAQSKAESTELDNQKKWLELMQGTDMDAVIQQKVEATLQQLMASQ